MIEPLSDLPDGVIGFRFSGHVSKDEYRTALLPPMKERIDRGDKVRLAIVIDNDFDRFEAGAMWEDMKFGFGSGLTHLSSWERMALVSDADWVRHAITLFGWLVPGDVKVFPLDQLATAKAWLAGSS
ncbi:MAG TPA: STAS/SEC14 domain-containing protein [Acidimicrobiales bacterium]